MTGSLNVRTLGAIVALGLSCCGETAFGVTHYYWDTTTQHSNSGGVVGGSGTWSTSAANWSPNISGTNSTTTWKNNVDPTNQSNYAADFTAAQGGAITVVGSNVT